MVSPKVASAKNLKKQGDGRIAEKFSSAQLSKVANEDLDEFDELDDADSRANDVELPMLLSMVWISQSVQPETFT